MKLHDAFRAHLASLALPEGPALVAVSGGLDSVVLLDLLHRAGTPRRQLVVAHADHGIHPDSASVAARVAAFADGLGLGCEIGRLALGAGAGETSAREARYAWLLALRERIGAAVVFTAHHADDQAETVLMRALEGSGPGGLSGMRPVSGVLVRPLLRFRRVELARYARERELAVWVDPANSDPAHLRSWLRCDLLPVIRARLPDVDARLRRLGSHAAREREAWSHAIDHLPGLDLQVEHGGISVAAAPLRTYDSALAQTVVIAAARRGGFAIGSRRAASVLNLVAGGASGREVPLGGGWRAELAFDRIRIVRGAHSAASSFGAATLAEEGAVGMVQVPADLPLLTARDIGAVLRAHAEAPAVTIAPSRDELGSNAVACSPPDVLPLRFGDDSFFPHLGRARALGIEPQIVKRSGLALDVDTQDFCQPPSVAGSKPLWHSSLNQFP
jgi:tRNA(Ile)-lysidine synthase